MAYDVFISHSSRDKPAADALCAALEAAKIRCWIAPRDLIPGRPFSGEIIRGIKSCRVMVLVFSANSNHSPDVLREVQLATRHRLHLINFRIESAPVSEDLDYFLGIPHWLDALTQPMAEHHAKLAESVKSLLALEPVAAPAGLDEEADEASSAHQSLGSAPSQHGGSVAVASGTGRVEPRSVEKKDEPRRRSALPMVLGALGLVVAILAVIWWRPTKEEKTAGVAGEPAPTPRIGTPAPGAPPTPSPTPEAVPAPAAPAPGSFTLSGSMASGKSIYAATCMSCHQMNGQGSPGAFPPLTSTHYVTGDPRRLVAILLKGISGPLSVDGKLYATDKYSIELGVPQLKDNRNLADVLNYVRNSFGNQSDVLITPEFVASVRAEFAEHGAPWTESELLNFPKPTSAETAPPPTEIPAAKPATGLERVNSLGMKLVPVPITGGPTGGKPVWFSVYETRVQDWIPYEREREGGDKDWKGMEYAGQKQGPTHPVVNVSWEEAKAFCAWLTKKEQAARQLPAGMVYRLPTDREWTCAVGLKEEPGKRSEEEVFPWGAQWPPPKGAGNYADEAARTKLGIFGESTVVEGKYDDGAAFTAAVGSYQPNQFGIYDLGGNAWEWCDGWSDESKTYHDDRGGSWMVSLKKDIRSGYRSMGTSWSRNIDQGFRVVLAEPLAE